ncbi:hypothetical protein [Plasticicumulans acidivorans]|uniref:Uncharacterized protein n=1 Tax=Plasticicumulans acidivorans TaxID=886464 RepID=A0A317MTV4_9GAMM|nr:hypothetical protein [Plasticicumulans acidivorans]PWV60535.1 hypothetical protein C7443_107109 [Plasticicumulans acidivorans]
MILVLLVVALGIGLWWFFSMHNAASMDRLKEYGFHPDYTLDDTVNPVAFDHQAQRIAFLGLSSTKIYRYDQVRRWELQRYESPGGNDMSEPRVHRELIFHLDDSAQPTVRLAGFDEEHARRWLQTLQQELPRAGR